MFDHRPQPVKPQEARHTKPVAASRESRSRFISRAIPCSRRVFIYWAHSAVFPAGISGAFAPAAAPFATVCRTIASIIRLSPAVPRRSCLAESPDFPWPGHHGQRPWGMAARVVDMAVERSAGDLARAGSGASGCRRGGRAVVPAAGAGVGAGLRGGDHDGPRPGVRIRLAGGLGRRGRFRGHVHGHRHAAALCSGRCRGQTRSGRRHQTKLIRC